MDKNNHKLKILYKLIKANTSATWHAAYAAHATNKHAHLLTAQKQQKQEPHKRAYLSENRGFGKKKSGEWAKSRK